jgi:penicillin-binding protein 1C
MTIRGRVLWTAAVVASAALAGIAYLRFGPIPRDLLDLSEAESTVVVDRNGEVLYESRGAEGGRTSWMTAGELPQTLVDATTAAEDHRFFSHIGIDPAGVGRAALRNLRRRRLVEGGSTITQQAAKLLLARGADAEARRSRGLSAKFREAVLALRLEHRFSKREILALYLNLAPYGNQLTGADRASRAYFGHSAALLTPAEAAFLASLPQRPSTFNPYRDPRRARLRQERVIAQMGESGALDPAGVQTAMSERLRLAPEAATFLAPHFVARVLDQAGPRRPRRIVTTLDASLQREVSGIIRAARPSLERHGAHNVAAVVLDNATGEWLAWEGSGDYDDLDHGGRIDGVVSPRQPGSALKPFTYALAFESGASPATVLPDVPSFFAAAGDGVDGVVYSPRNYDSHFRGPLRARQALAESQNVPAVALASRVGGSNLLRFLRTAGLTTFDKTGAYYGLGLTLGDAEVRLDELVAAYSAFARGGRFMQPSLIPRTSPPESQTLMSPRTAFWITDILSDDDARAYAFGRGGSLEFPFAVAAKTGTSQAYHDNWTIGYTRDVTVGVWVGNFDRRPLIGSSGVTGAGPIFHAVMLAAASRATGSLPDPLATATRAPAAHTTRRVVCALSGLIATPACPRQIEEWMPDDVDGEPCDWHRETPRGVVVRWPAAYQEWAAGQRLLNVVVAAPSRTSSSIACSAGLEACPTGGLEGPHYSKTKRSASVQVLSPPDGAVYLIDPTLRREFQTVGLRGATESAGPLEWRVDDALIGSVAAESSLDWPLTPGRHVISARDAQGRHASATIVVK